MYIKIYVYNNDNKCFGEKIYKPNINMTQSKTQLLTSNTQTS